jgi:hypothetical protein
MVRSSGYKTIEVVEVEVEQRVLLTGPSPRGWHRLQQFLECPQKFAWHYRFGRDSEGKLLSGEDEPNNAPPLVKGSLIHLGLAHHYARMRETQQGRDPELYLTPADAMDLVSETNGPEWTKWKSLATDCTLAYIEHYAEEKMKILRVEEMMEGTFGGYRFTGRLDLVTEDSRGRVWAWDHKTTGRIQSKQQQFYSVSGQLIGYQWLARGAFGEKFAGMRVNLVQHGHGDFRFERPRMLQAPALYNRFPQTVVDAEQGIAALDSSGRDHDHWPAAMNEMTCYGRYGACRHLEQCKWGVSTT